MNKQYISFVPKSDAGQAIWAGNFSDKVVTIGPALGLDAATVTAAQEAASRLKTTIESVEVKKKDLEQALALKRQSKVDDLQIICSVAKKMKVHDDYEEQLGSALGIVGSSIAIDPSGLRPTISLKGYPGKVTVSFKLQTMNCITIYCRLKGTNGWERLGNDYESPYEDTRPLTVANQPEIREYAARYFNGREEVGQMSQIETIAFGG